jgi:hypothetical protein
MDREHERRPWNLLPFFQTPHKLRIAVEEVRALPDSPFDALMWGWVAPPLEESERRWSPGAYRLALNLMDARKLPRSLAKGHVLAVAAAASRSTCARRAERAGPGAAHRAARPSRGPGGCAELPLRVRKVLHLSNPITGIEVEALELDAPERPQVVFTSRWQRERDGLPPPQVGGRVDGTFLFLGTVTGGLPGQARAGGRSLRLGCATSDAQGSIAGSLRPFLARLPLEAQRHGLALVARHGLVAALGVPVLLFGLALLRRPASARPRRTRSGPRPCPRP